MTVGSGFRHIDLYPLVLFMCPQNGLNDCPRVAMRQDLSISPSISYIIPPVETSWVKEEALRENARYNHPPGNPQREQQSFLYIAALLSRKRLGLE